MKNITLSIIAIFTMFTVNAQVTHYATSVIDFSSQYSETQYAAQEILGEPDVYPNYEDNVNAWAHATMDGQHEYMVIGFDPMPITKVQIFETYACGAIDTVYIRKESDGEWIKIFETTAINGLPITSAQITEIEYQTDFNVDAVRFAIDSEATLGWQEYDAVAIVNDPVSTQELKNGSVKLYPNPATNEIYLNTNFNENHVQVDILNIAGKIVMSEVVILENGNAKLKTNLKSGIYFLKMQTSDKSVTKKIIIK